ncbi:MAG: hypothetical protein ACLPV8_28820 [Steroidobacteraceae bacterium]
MLSIACLQGASANGPLQAGVIVVKGAWWSASDSLTSVPEGGTLTDHAYNNAYFDLVYSLSHDWTQRYEGPPPSDSGYYVLAQIEPAASSQNSRGHVLIAAQDMFFTLAPANNALEWINHYRDHLGADYKVERAPAEAHIANRSFVRFDYASPVAKLHWRVLATEIRCHIVHFVFTGRSLRQMQGLIETMNTMKLPVEGGPGSADGGARPVCIKDFASVENVIERADPVFSESRFNPVPVRIVIDIQGRVKHMHFLSAFPGQVASISAALLQWRFRPYVLDGRPVEVETGILFGHAPRPTVSALR